MTDGNTINSAENWNLLQTYNKIKDMSNSGEYSESVKLAEKGLSMACQTNDESWIQKFDNILVDMIKQHNQVKSSEPQSNEKAIYNVKVHYKVVGSEKNLTKIKGIGASVEKKLINIGVETIDELASSEPKEIAKIKGIGLNTATRLIAEAQNYSNINKSEGNPRTLRKEKIQEEKPKSVSSKSQLKTKDEIKNNKQHDIGLVKFLTEKRIKNENFANEITINSRNDSNFDDENNQIIIPELKIYDTQKVINKIIEKDQDGHISDNNITSFNDKNLYQEYIDKDDELDFDYENELENYTNNYNESDDKQRLLELLNYEKTITKRKATNYSTDLDYPINNEYEMEKLEKIQVEKIVKNFEHELKLLNYRIVSKNSILLNDLSKKIDILALKTLEINKKVSLILLFPITFCDLKGNLIVSNASIDYNPYNQKITLNERLKNLIMSDFEKELNSAQNNVFQSIIYEGKLFHFVKKAITKSITVEKTRKNLRLFIRSGNMIFKVIVDPILISQNDPAFLEKSILFPYQKNTNLHIINMNNLADLIRFLEKKYSLIETHTEQKNYITSYFNALDKFRITIRNYSVPFLLFGAVFCIIIILQYLFLISTFTSLGYAAIVIYAIIIWYSYIRFSKTQKEVIEDYKTPYYQNKIHVDETDLTIIKHEISTELLDQFIYECLGKNENFSFTAEIEEEKVDTLINHFKRSKAIESVNIIEELDTNPEENFESSQISGKIISKYSSFLED